MTLLLWVLAGWVVSSVLVGWGLSRWFRWLRGDFDRE